MIDSSRMRLFIMICRKKVPEFVTCGIKQAPELLSLVT